MKALLFDSFAALDSDFTAHAVSASKTAVESESKSALALIGRRVFI